MPLPPHLSSRGLPIVNGIELLSTQSLPDRLKPIFTFPLFNAVQSKCFHAIYETDNNFVLSSPTSSGKTVILELAICRLASFRQGVPFKVVYQAPTRSLCSERLRDWQLKFSHLNLKCAELTGDTEQSQLKYVQTADIIITTPEKWDSMTRKWKDHQKLMELIKLFLIDEVHILKEDRGACLEAVVSRMKSVGSDVRFIALSASIPNSQDIATWLGKNSHNADEPAASSVFGEEFRPVKLQRYVYGYNSDSNDFAFDKICNGRLFDVISNHSANKPIIVFCFTRASTEATAKCLAEWWNANSLNRKYWQGSRCKVEVEDAKLKTYIPAGVAFHHAGTSQADRNAVEKAYLKRHISVICCTSTLAVGVNLPCHLVIIKNTICYQNTGCKEYSDLEIMQMLGRAGRPQYDDTAVAIIMTRQEKVHRYEKMVSGQEILESRLHLNLIDHLNAEIGLGTVNSLKTAQKWLAGTFLAVRFRANPGHYKLDDSNRSKCENVLDTICQRDVELLKMYGLASPQEPFKSTEFGDAMARYYVQFDTMKILLGLPPRATISEILFAVAQASEFKPIRLRMGEKQMFKDINVSPFIKFPIKVDLALTAHKVSLILQSMLGGLDLRNDDRFKTNVIQFSADQSFILQHVHRMVRCVIDCQLCLEDSIAARNAMALARSLGAKVWDDSPLQLMQIEKIGPAAYRKLVNVGIKSIEELERADPHSINIIMSRNPPFGHQLLESAKTFPKLRISVKAMGPPAIRNSTLGKRVRLQIRADIGFINDSLPKFFNKKPIHVCLLSETSDGRKLHFCKISAQKLDGGQAILFTADLTSPQQLVTCYVSCDDIAGTLRHATLRPDIPASAFSLTVVSGEIPPKYSLGAQTSFNGLYTNRNLTKISSKGILEFQQGRTDSAWSENYDDSDIEDADLRNAAANMEYEDIDGVSEEFPQDYQHILAGTGKQRQPAHSLRVSPPVSPKVKLLSNGKYACDHNCKNKQKCRHLCCREGMDKPSKASKNGIRDNTRSNGLSRKESGAISKDFPFPTYPQPRSQIFLKRNEPHTPGTLGSTVDDTKPKPVMVVEQPRLGIQADDNEHDVIGTETSNDTDQSIQSLSCRPKEHMPPYLQNTSASTGNPGIVEINLSGQSLKRGHSPMGLQHSGRWLKRLRINESPPIASPTVSTNFSSLNADAPMSPIMHTLEAESQSDNEIYELISDERFVGLQTVDPGEGQQYDANGSKFVQIGDKIGSNTDEFAPTDVDENYELEDKELAVQLGCESVEKWLLREFGSCVEFV